MSGHILARILPDAVLKRPDTSFRKLLAFRLNQFWCRMPEALVQRRADGSPFLVARRFALVQLTHMETISMMTRSIKPAVFAAWVIILCFMIAGLSPSGSAAAGVGEIAMSGPADVYATSCSKCHGSDGKANTAKGRRTRATDFTGSDWNAAESRGIRIITNGKSDMPAFKNKLTADEIRDVFHYVLRFRR